MFHVRVVEVISNQGIAQIFHMDTDLMGAAGFQLKGDQAVPIFFVRAKPCLPLWSFFADPKNGALENK